MQALPIDLLREKLERAQNFLDELARKRLKKMKFRLKIILESDIKKQVLSFDLKVVKMALDLMLSGN